MTKGKSKNPAAGNKNASGKPVFHPATANVDDLVGHGFVGKLVKLGQEGGKPSEFKFENAATGEVVRRTFPRGLCGPIEEAAFDANTAPVGELLDRGFVGRITALGEFRGKPSRFEFSKGDLKVVRTFFRGRFKDLEDGLIMRGGVKMRQHMTRTR